MSVNRLSFQAFIDKKSFEVLNSEFTKAKCYVMYTDENRNGSFISKETVENAISTIFNIPVIAEIKELKDGSKDYGTHGGKIIISSDGIEYVQTTIPYGVVPESANPRWEMVDDKEYLVADVILWTGRYEQLSMLLEDGERPHSMEINPLATSEGKQGYVNIDSFEFSALCILGEDVEPCFEEAKFEVYSSDSFKSIFEEMKNGLKELFKDKEKCAEDVSEGEIEDDKSEGETEEDTEEKEEMTLDNAESKENFALTAMEKRRILDDNFPSEYQTDDDGDCIYRLEGWVMDYDEKYVYLSIYEYSKDKGYSDYYVRATYTIDEANKSATIDKASFEEILEKWVTVAEANQIDADRESQYTQLQNSFNELTVEVETLREFKQSIDMQLEKEIQDQKDNLVSSFEEQLGDNEEFKKIKEKFSEMALEDIEDQCYKILGKTKFNKKIPEAPNNLLIKVNKNIVTEEEKPTSRYGSATKYFNKQKNE